MSKVVDMDGKEIIVGCKIRQAHILNNIFVVEMVDSDGVNITSSSGNRYYVDACMLDSVWEIVE